jgi:hypothetical protein
VRALKNFPWLQYRLPDLIRHPVFLDTFRIPGRALLARNDRKGNKPGLKGADGFICRMSLHMAWALIYYCLYNG